MLGVVFISEEFSEVSMGRIISHGGNIRVIVIFFLFFLALSHHFLNFFLEFFRKLRVLLFGLFFKIIVKCNESL
jgi:hypothetical protein